MIIVVEGIDKSGKTTLINAIRKKHDNFVIKSNHRPKNNDCRNLVKVYEEMYAMTKVNPDRLWIFDRYYPSQLVYSYLRHHDSFYDQRFKTFDELLAKDNALIVYVDPGMQTLVRRHRSQKDEYIDKKQIANLRSRYRMFITNYTSVKVLILRSTDLNKNVDEILKVVNNG